MSRPQRGLKDQKPVPHNKSLMAAFEKQRKGKECSICGKTIFLGVFRSHFNTCTAKIDEDECMITQVVTAEEKIGPPITLDDDVNAAGTSAQDENTSYAVKRRRSARIALTSRGESPPEEKPVIERKQPRRRLIIEQETTLTVTTPKTREDIIMQETGTFEVEDVAASGTTPEVTADDRMGERNEQHEVDEDPPPEEPPVGTDHLDEAVEDRPATQNQTLFEMIMTMDGEPSTTQSAPTEIDLTEVKKEEEDSEQVSEPGQIYERYFVRQVNRIFDKIVHSEASPYQATFWKEKNGIFTRFKNLTKNEKEVLLRMFLRRTEWFSLLHLEERYSEYPEMKGILSNLETGGFVQNGRNVITLDEVCPISPLPILQKVAKQYKIDIRLPKQQLIAALKKFAASQNDLFGRTRGVETQMVKVFLRENGMFYRVAREIRLVFKAAFTLYSPTETNSALVIDEPRKNLESELLFSLLRQEKEEVKFVAPKDGAKIIEIFNTYEELESYVEAKELEIEIATAIYTNTVDNLAEVDQRLRNLLASSDLCYFRSFTPSVRRFSSPYVLVRTLGLIASAYEKKKMYADAVNLQRFLLRDQKTQGFCTDHRGKWWERLALNLEFHLKEPDEAMAVLEDGLKDGLVLERDRVILQDRAVKLTKGTFVKVIEVEEPKEMNIVATVLRKNLGDSRQNHFIYTGPDGSVNQCSVEEVARQHYLSKEGMTHGLHVEGSIWHTVFGLLFFDIIFEHGLENVWFSEIQTHPVDLNYPEFYKNRRDAFRARLRWMQMATEDELRERVEKSWVHFDVANTEIAWNLFQDVDECMEFIMCCPRNVLVGTFKRLAKDYRNTRSGFPDLTLWNPFTSTVVVVEVKGPGDRLSSKQRLWLQFFTKLGLRAEVCYVKADRTMKI